MDQGMLPPPADSSMTVGEYLGWIAPRIWDWEGAEYAEILWPADVFGVAASLLRRTGGYLSLVTQWPPVGVVDLNGWIAENDGLADAWRSAFNVGNTAAIPEAVRGWWRLIRNSGPLPLAALADDHSPVCSALLQLVAASDQAYNRLIEESTSQHDRFAMKANELLALDEQLCLNIDSSRVRVLPKIRPPQYGMTPRSLSQYLALCQGVEVQPTWKKLQSTVPPDRSGNDRFNVLIVPYPHRVQPSQFEACRVPGHEMPDCFGYFNYSPPNVEPAALVKWLLDLLFKVESELGPDNPLHLAVLPECALRQSEFEAVADGLSAAGSTITLISGVVTAPSEGGHFTGNKAFISYPVGGRVKITTEQSKHHRWQLTPWQIEQYAGLTQSLPCPDKRHRYWEASAMGRRQIHFLQIETWFTLCVLVCEDLTRVEPVGDQIRSVAPDLVIALLADGAQIESRWPGKYASTLAEDPGSAVLTVSSAGMVALSSQKMLLEGKDSNVVSHSIALWKQDETTKARPIDLLGATVTPPDHLPEDTPNPYPYHAVLLRLNREEVTCYSADGRHRVKKNLRLEAEVPGRIVHIRADSEPPFAPRPAP